MGKNRFTIDNLRELGLIEVSPGVYKPANRGKVSPYIKQQKGMGTKREFVADIKSIDLNPSKMRLNAHRGRIEVKPISINKAFQGRRFKTKIYEAYEKAVLSVLTPCDFPSAPYRVTLTFGFSSKLADLDNPTKLILDILQKKYPEFNDRYVNELHIYKQMTEKRKEFCEFLIETI